MAVAAPWFDLYVSQHMFVKNYIAGIGTGILLLITLWKKPHTSNTFFYLSWVKISWLSLFILGTLSILWSVNIDFTINKWMTWLIVFFAFIVGYHLKLERDTLFKLCWGLLIAAFIIAIIGILQYWFDPFTLTQAIKPASTFGNKNMSTQPIVLILPLVLFLFFSNKISTQQVWVVSIFTSLIMVFIFYTRTRSSWLSIIIELILISGFLFFKRKSLTSFLHWNSHKTKASLFALALFMVLINFTDQGFQFSWSQAQNAIEGAVGSGNERFNIWVVAIDMIKVSPLFGTGLGSWYHNEIQAGFGTYNVMNFQYVHNDLLELGVELGVVGVIILLIATTLLSLAVFKILAKDNKSDAWFYFLLWVALSGSFVQMQFSFPYQLAVPSLLLGIYIGLITKYSEHFIQPIKVIKFRVSNIYHQSVKVFWLVLVFITSSIHLDWMNTYSTLNDFVKNRTMYLLSTETMPVVYYIGLQRMLLDLSILYKKAGDYDGVISITQQALKYWPNHNNILHQYTATLILKKRYKEALKVVKHLKEVSGKGYFLGHMLEVDIYFHTNQFKKLNQDFLKIINTQEALLSLNRITYQSLFERSLQYNLHQYSEQLYDQYIKYHSYACAVENNMAMYYFHYKKYQQLKTHVDIILNSEDKTCLNPVFVKKLKQQGLY